MLTTSATTPDDEMTTGRDVYYMEEHGYLGLILEIQPRGEYRSSYPPLIIPSH